MKTNAGDIMSRRRRLGKVVKSLESAFKVEMRRREVDDNPEVKLELDALAKKQRALDRLLKVPEEDITTKQTEKIERLREIIVKDKQVLDGKRGALEVKLCTELSQRLKRRQSAKRTMADGLTLSRMLEHLISRCKANGMTRLLHIKQLRDKGRSLSFLTSKELKLPKQQQQPGCFIKHAPGERTAITPPLLGRA